MNPERLEAEFGVKMLAPGARASVDIVAIHGVDGDRISSWTAADASQTWLQDKDMLPRDIPEARILTYGYNSVTWGDQRPIRIAMESHAQDLIAQLVAYRTETHTPRNRPIIFLAHSTGGIILKFALILANKTHEGHLGHHRSFAEDTAGILFLGTPHQGTAAAKFFVKLYSLNGKFDNALTEDLRKYSETLQDQLSAYNAISHQYITKFYFEEYKTRFSDGTQHMIVPRSSAVVQGAVNVEPLTLNTDHLGLAKLKPYRDGDYLTVVWSIRSIISDINVC
ncbi:hypothetical protein BU17DRAFT_82343 [Hysterangium stoloniferum]|nr:hypothetical protein BU17DRAFT_82343 [Hysterangium stoloniferum]